MRLNKSFTLIELIIVMGIIAFFAGMGLVSFGNSSQINNLRQVEDRVTDGLEYAKQKANAPDQIICAAGLEEAYAFISNPSNFSVQECCRDASNNLSSCVVNTNYTFPPNISRIAGTSPIVFYSLNKGSNGTSTAIRIRNSSISKCLDVSVSTSGAITVSNLITPC